MAEQPNRMLNPMLALVTLYQKDGKSIKDVITDITSRLNALGLDLKQDYIDDKVLPWVLSFLFMTTAQQLFDEYIQSLSGQAARGPKPSGPPFPPPADIA